MWSHLVPGTEPLDRRLNQFTIIKPFHKYSARDETAVNCFTVISSQLNQTSLTSFRARWAGTLEPAHKTHNPHGKKENKTRVKSVNSYIHILFRNCMQSQRYQKDIQ